MAKPQRAKGRQRRKVRKNIALGQAHIKTSFNNTLVTLTDKEGNVIAWESAGAVGFKGSRKSTPLLPIVAIAVLIGRWRLNRLMGAARRRSQERQPGTAGYIETEYVVVDDEDERRH